MRAYSVERDRSPCSTWDLRILSAQADSIVLVGRSSEDSMRLDGVAPFGKHDDQAGSVGGSAGDPSNPTHPATGQPVFLDLKIERLE